MLQAIYNVASWHTLTSNEIAARLIAQNAMRPMTIGEAMYAAKIAAYTAAIAQEGVGQVGATQAAQVAIVEIGRIYHKMNAEFVADFKRNLLSGNLALVEAQLLIAADACEWSAETIAAASAVIEQNKVRFVDTLQLTDENGEAWTPPAEITAVMVDEALGRDA